MEQGGEPIDAITLPLCNVKGSPAARRVSIALRHSHTEFTEFYSLRVC